MPCTVRHKKGGQTDKRSVIKAKHEGPVGILIKFKSYVSRKAHRTPAEIGDKSGSHAQVPPAEASMIPKEQEEYGGESSSEGEKSSLDELITNDPAVARSEGRRQAHVLVFTASDLSKRSLIFFPLLSCALTLFLAVYFFIALRPSACLFLFGEDRNTFSHRGRRPASRSARRKRGIRCTSEDADQRSVSSTNRVRRCAGTHADTYCTGLECRFPRLSSTAAMKICSTSPSKRSTARFFYFQLFSLVLFQSLFRCCCFYFLFLIS